MGLNYTRVTVVYLFNFDQEASNFYRRCFEVMDFNKLKIIDGSYYKIVSKKIEIKNENTLSMNLEVETSFVDNEITARISVILEALEKFFQTIARHFIYPFRFSRVLNANFHPKNG